MFDWTKTYLMRKLCNFIGKHEGSYTVKLIVGTTQNCTKW